MAVIPRINYQHLLYFWSVVRTGSVTRACEELALSPPAVSSQLRTLEERLGEKLLTRAGRGLVPTETGKLVFGYADEIFTLGRELLDALEQRPSARPLRLLAGIDDVLPKEIAYRLLEPGLRIGRPVRVVCREASLERLVTELAMHEIDVVLSDAPVTPSLNVRVHSHPLGHCKVHWMATPAVAKTLRRQFPAALEGYPVLLPTDDTAIRRALDEWFERRGVRPLLLGEFEDYAMLREFANAGHGVAPVPSILERQFRRQYGLVRVGIADGVRAEFHLISAERKIRHPAVAAMTQAARQLLAAG